MKKRILTLLFILFFITTPAFAVSVKVSAMQEFTTVQPAETLKVMTLEPVEFKNGLLFPEGTIIKGEIFDVKQPKRGKLNASFKFKPIYYSYNGQKKELTESGLTAKYAPYKELNKAELATSAVSTAGSMIFKIPGFSEAISFTKGFIKNPDNNRLKSGAKQIYKDSFFSYIEEGKDVSIKKDEMFILKFKLKDEPDEEDEEEAKENNTAETQNAGDETDISPEEITPVNEQNNLQTPESIQKETTTETNIVPANSTKPPTAVRPVNSDEELPPASTPIQPVDPYEVLREVESAQ